MIRRIIAAFAALILAAVGVFLVMSYANTADERAMADMETVDTLVATAHIPQGTPAEELSDLVEVQAVPAKFLVDDAVDDMDDLEGELLTAELLPGEQLTNARFATADEIRRRGDFALPEEAEDLHQLTINLPNPQALGGSIAAGDTVGLFGTYELLPPTGWVIGANGELEWDPNAARTNDPNSSEDEAGDEGSGDEGGSEDGSEESITFTDLVLDKVLVVRVEGGFIAGGSGDDEVAAAAQDSIHVTIALEPQDAARVIQTMHTGTVWLTLSPEDAPEADIDAVIPSAPTRVTGVLE
ncbi:hypothetical protein [Ornithinimicrobium murale]|uniref:hypothetical protein n=1 Tax=Ornithinimicrobium murale TaxID=1050153 RepID=UPI000E0D3392|nr:hypothetical protein [Ornithinimicrobium murale]